MVKPAYRVSRKAAISRRAVTFLGGFMRIYFYYRFISLSIITFFLVESFER